MIVDNLKARCVDIVARELARKEVSRGCSTSEWLLAIEACRDEAAERINEMSNIQLLDVISEVLVSES